MILLIVLLLAAVGIRWDHNRRGHYFWQPAPAAVETPAAPDPAPAEAAK
jgi:hypothetical protein